jgi:hypothetical protein
MTAVPRQQPDPRSESHDVCTVCSKPSELTICDACAERLRLEALSRKKHEEQGDAWSHWE